MDRFTSLEAFVRVVDQSGFAAAARSLNMSAGMVSKHVNGLERRLGTRLLNRTTRRLALTDAGRQFYEQARLVLRGLDEAERAVTARSSQPVIAARRSSVCLQRALYCAVPAWPVAAVPEHADRDRLR